MPLRLIRLLDSVNPAGASPGDRALALRSLRLSCLSGAVVTPLLGVLLHASGPVVDPWAVRWGVTAYALIVFGLTYVVPAVRRHTKALHLSGIYGVTLYSGALVYANGLSPIYSVGYLLSFTVLALSYGLADTQPGPFARFLLFSTAVLLVGLAAPYPGVPRLVFGAGGIAMAALTYVTVGARLATYGALEKSQARLAAAETLAGAGNWEVCPGDGTRVWSEGTWRLFGLTPGRVPPRMTDLVHPDDRDEVEAVVGRLFSEAGTLDNTFRIVTAGGETRTLRAVSRSEAGPDGSVERVRGALLDVTAQVHRETVLVKALDQAEEGARSKSAFLANMSHEIRTPLTAIIGYAQLLGEEAGPEYRDLVGPIETGGERLLATLNSVLDLARMEAGHSGLVVGSVDAGAEAQAVVEMLAAQASAKGIELHADLPSHPVLVRGDRDALSRALTNLVSNAVKFTREGCVTVSVAHRPDGRVAVAVADTGQGMGPEFLARLYEPFHQASTGWARSHEGTGLGLTITHRLVEGMGGEITVESEPGRGTRFAVVLPAAGPTSDGPEAVSPVVGVLATALF